MLDVCQKLEAAFAAGQFKNHITHVRFPSYKNLAKDLRINFSFPVTALVGGNGSNKTSILRALEACPKGYDLGNWWFSTSMDPMKPGLHPRYIYGYNVPGLNGVAEVRKARMQRAERRTDYFETTKPADRMKAMPSDETVGRDFRQKTRWNPIDKNVVYLDFRGELPAYEKYMQHPATRDRAGGYEERKSWIRAQSKRVHAALEGKHKKDTYYNRKVVHEIVTFEPEATAEVSNILGRQYQSIRMIRHDYFERLGWTVELTTDHHAYSEAYAGSGEFAVIVMVHQIMTAPKASLILLDEPETSLHPASQEKLMSFLLRQCLKSKHQVVMATHSPHMIGPLPDNAIKLLAVEPQAGEVRLMAQESSQTDAFFRLGSPKPGKLTVFVEDSLAAALIKLLVTPLGEASFERLEVKAFPGGAAEIKKRLIPSLSQASTGPCVVVLDGDMKPNRAAASWVLSDDRNLIDPTLLTDGEVDAAFADCFSDGSRMDISLNGGDDSLIGTHKNDVQRATLGWVNENVYFLPGRSPEELICNLLGRGFANSKDAKAFFSEKTAREKGLPSWRVNEITSKDILETQMRELPKLDLSGPEWEALRSAIARRL
jgi:predicted ATPase